MALSERSFRPLLAIAVSLAGVVITYVARDQWLRRPPAEVIEEPGGGPTDQIIVNEQAQRNLDLAAKRLTPQTYWKTIQIPGMVVDRTGRSDRGIVAPAMGVVSKINHFPGEVVRPGDVLFMLTLLSESLHQTQTDLFRTTQEIALTQAQRKRLSDTGGAVPESRIIEVTNQLARLDVAVKSHRHELLNRGFSPELLEGVASGKFVTEIPIIVPAKISSASVDRSSGPSVYEMQELKVDLGQQVQSGQTLCVIANHRDLAVEGRAFRDETPHLERSVRERWPVEVDFQEDPSAGWGPIEPRFPIRHLANTIDPVKRTFAFLMPLENESRAVEDEGRTQLLWRFRPGQKVRIQVRVEKLENVFVLPSDAVAREGADAFVFTQNVNTFYRKPVHVVLQDRQHVVVANDGSIAPGSYVVQSAAAQLSRMVKAGSSGVPKGYHVHADGSLHKNEDEAK